MRRNLDAVETRPGQSRPEEADTDIGGRESSERADSGDESCLERESFLCLSQSSLPVKSQDGLTMCTSCSGAGRRD